MEMRAVKISAMKVMERCGKVQLLQYLTLNYFEHWIDFTLFGGDL